MRFNEKILYDSKDFPVIKTFHSSVMPERRVLNEHHHTECELSLFVSGSGIYSVHGREYKFAPGNMFLFGSNEPHCITEIHEELDLLNIHFEPRLIWENDEATELLDLFFSRNERFENMFPGDDFILCSMILNIEKELKEMNAGYKTGAKCSLFSALIHIIRKYECTLNESISRQNTRAVRQLREAMNFINENLSQKLTLKEIADRAYLTETYFSSLFKKYNGISPWDYVMIKRVELAIEMLKTTNLTKLEIAERCGFESSSNFYKAFAKVTGKTPSEYTNRKE